MKGKRVAWIVLSMLIVGIGALVVATMSPAQAGGLNCKGVSCAAPQCLEGEHLAVPPGACCPVCVPD